MLTEETRNRMANGRQEGRFPRVLWTEWLQVAVSAAPALLALNFGATRPAAACLFGAIAAFLCLNLYRRRPLANLTLIIGLLPAIMLLREVAFFSLVTVLLALAIAAVLLHSQRSVRVLADSGFIWVSILALLYWLVSFMLTARYSSNLRVLELVLAAGAILLLAEDPAQMATALFGVMTSSFMIGVGLFRVSERLGIATINSITMGNPIQFGLPLTLVFLLLAADRGRWFLLERRPVLRLLLASVVAFWLVLSTSRGSWVVVAGGLGMLFALGRGQRRAVLGIAGVLLVGVLIALQTDRADSLRRAYDRTFSAERSIRNRTSGRSDQWRLFPVVMRDAPPWGFGPGSGAAVYSRYSWNAPEIDLHPGSTFMWHSLYQQAGVELGPWGLGFLLLLLAAGFRRGLRTLKRTGLAAPLLGITGYALIGISVAAIDAASGLFLGFGMLRLAPPRQKVAAGRAEPPWPLLPSVAFGGRASMRARSAIAVRGPGALTTGRDRCSPGVE